MLQWDCQRSKYLACESGLSPVFNQVTFKWTLMFLMQSSDFHLTMNRDYSVRTTKVRLELITLLHYKFLKLVGSLLFSRAAAV